MIVIELTIPWNERETFVRWCDAHRVPINADEEDEHGNRRFRVVAHYHSTAKTIIDHHWGSDRH